MLLSVKEAAERFCISERRVQKLCEEGRIEGAQMISSVWIIPDTAAKPIDARLTPDLNEMIPLSELCKELSVSLATGRNWIKLGKLVPTVEVKRTAYFSSEYVKKIKEDIKSGTNAALKSRRNKKYVSGSNIYNSYVSRSSCNLPIVQSLFDTIDANKIEITDEIVVAIIADCAIQFILSRTCSNNMNTAGLSAYLNGDFNNNPYIHLIDSLLQYNPFVISTYMNFPELFRFQYTYEKNEDILGLLYISLLNISNRKATGSYYTPTEVVKKLCSRLFSVPITNNVLIIDPCCGTGNFILQLPDSIEFQNIFGNDIDPISVRISRINFALKYQVSDVETLEKHITEMDYLSFPSESRYDYIIGNPPWGYEYTEAEKNKLRKKYKSASGTSIESYDVFVEQAISNLNKGGVMSFVLPEAFLNVKAHEAIRSQIIKTSSLQYIEFLGNAFDKVQCPCVIMELIYTAQPLSTRGLIIHSVNQEYTINTERTVTPDCFSFAMTDQEYSIINKIEQVKNKTTLFGKATFALGIVTGNNKEYITSQKLPSNEMILKGSDIFKYHFQQSENFITYNPDSFQQVAPTAHYRAKEKLLYRFICNQLVFAYDNNQTLSLNSCNIVIPHIPDLEIKYILSILNSRVAQFYFKKKFNSVKVLRSHIEQIPIPHISKTTQDQIIQIVDSILRANNEIEISSIYEKLDTIVAGLFNLSDEEYSLIKQSMAGENLFLF